MPTLGESMPLPAFFRDEGVLVLELEFFLEFFLELPNTFLKIPFFFFLVGVPSGVLTDAAAGDAAAAAFDGFFLALPLEAAAAEAHLQKVWSTRHVEQARQRRTRKVCAKDVLANSMRSVRMAILALHGLRCMACAECRRRTSVRMATSL